MGPLTPGSRMRGGVDGAAEVVLSTSSATESVQVSPSSSVTVRKPRRHPVVEYGSDTTPVVYETPSIRHSTESIGFEPGARQAIQSALARPPATFTTVGLT